METRVFCVELKMGPSGHMDSTGIFPDSNTREFGPRRTTQRQPPRPTHKCNAPRLPFHVHLTHDLTRAASALPLHTAALAFVSFGIVLVQVQVQVPNPRAPLLSRCVACCGASGRLPIFSNLAVLIFRRVCEGSPSLLVVLIVQFRGIAKKILLPPP